MEEVKEFLQPLFQEILEAVTVETVEDWACCLTDISVRKINVMLLHTIINMSNNDPRLIVIHVVSIGCLMC